MSRRCSSDAAFLLFEIYSIFSIIKPASIIVLFPRNVHGTLRLSRDISWETKLINNYPQRVTLLHDVVASPQQQQVMYHMLGTEYTILPKDKMIRFLLFLTGVCGMLQESI